MKLSLNSSVQKYQLELASARLKKGTVQQFRLDNSVCVFFQLVLVIYCNSF